MPDELWGAGGALLAVVAMVVYEVPAVSRWIALKLYRRAVARLPKRVREIKREEWAAEMEAMHGSRIACIVLAASLNRAAAKISDGDGATGRSVKRRRPASTTIEVGGLLVMFNLSNAQPLPNGQLLIPITATNRGGQSWSSQLILDPGSGLREVQAALRLKYEMGGSVLRLPPSAT
jgi:hypothetical protein